MRLICIQTNGKPAIYLFEQLDFCIGIDMLVRWQSYFWCLYIHHNGMVGMNRIPYQSTNGQSFHCMDLLQRAVRTMLNCVKKMRVGGRGKRKGDLFYFSKSFLFRFVFRIVHTHTANNLRNDSSTTHWFWHSSNVSKRFVLPKQPP